MKFGKYLSEKQRPEWADHYLDYKALKDLVKEASKQLEELGPSSYSPRTTSLTVQRATASRDNAEERFFQLLESEVDKVGQFTAQVVDGLRDRLYQLQSHDHENLTEEEKKNLLYEAQQIGDEFLALEKFVNLNYLGFHKILKKHDKNLPQTPCRQFYISHLHNQPWVQGNYSDLLVALSNLYADLRGDAVQEETVVESEEPSLVYSSSQYWVKMGDVSSVKHAILPYLPVYQFNDAEYTGDSLLVNSVYFDNSSLEVYHSLLNERPNAVEIRITWFGSQESNEVFIERKSKRQRSAILNTEEEFDSFPLPEEMVLSYLEGELPVTVAQDVWSSKGETEDQIKRHTDLFEEVQKLVDTKQLKPTIRIQFMRTLFQIPFDSTVRIKLDTNISMLKESGGDGDPILSLSGRWFRDPSLPIHRTEVTRFPHAVLQLDLSLEQGQTTPEWVAELIESGLLSEIDGFRKNLHGTATLYPDVIQALPYWVDDESVRASMLSSAPEQPVEVAPSARDQMAAKIPKPRKGYTDSLREPLLGRRNSRVEEEYDDNLLHPVASFESTINKVLEWWFSKPPMAHKPRIPGVTPNEKSEPKTILANERTWLSWVHIGLILGSVAAGLLGFSESSYQKHSLFNDELAMIALILIPMAMIITIYALLVYYWRSKAIKQKQFSYFDDRRGPYLLAGVVVSGLVSIFIISFVDLIQGIRDSS